MRSALDLVCPICRKQPSGTFERKGPDVEVPDGLDDDPDICVEEIDGGYRIYEHGAF